MATANGLTKVSGNIANVGNQGPAGRHSPPVDMMDFSSPSTAGQGHPGKRNQTTLLTYPSGVDTDEQQGHYIMFEIYKQDPSKLAATKAVKGVKSVVNDLKKETGQSDANNSVEGIAAELSAEGQKAFDVAAKSFSGTFEKHSGPNSLQVAKKATTRMDTAIALYMPPSVQVSYGAKYNEQEIGVMAEAGNAAIQAFMQTEGSVVTKLAAGGGKLAGGAVSGVINKLKGMLPAGAEAMFAINSGSIITPRMELMFEGIQRRSFSFNFVFIPKSKPEADTIEAIVQKFKYHMASDYGRGGNMLNLGGVDGVREMTIPDFFQITYMHMGATNPHLNRIKKCVLANASVEYGADRYKAYAGGRPQTTKLSLTFNELEIITKTYIEDGF